MKKGDEIKIYREQNGFVLKVHEVGSTAPDWVFVFSKQKKLLADLKGFISDAQCDIDDHSVEDMKKAQRKIMYPNEE